MPSLTDVDTLFGWVMALVRAGALVSVLPAFSAQPVPMQLRLVLSVFLGFLARVYAPAHASFPSEPATLALVAANEFLIGLFMGMIVRVIVFAAEMAGQIISAEMGLSTGNSLDPNSGALFTVGSILFSNLVGLLMLTSGAYRAILFAYLRSYQLAPIGNLGFDPSALDLFVTQTGRIFLLAVQMAAPMMAVNFVVTLTFGVIGKVSPSINVLTESYSARILAGMTVLGLTISLAAQYMLGFLNNAPNLMLELVRR